MTTEFNHLSVLLSEAVDGLAIEADGIYIDATFGRGGHSRAILSQLSENGQLIAFDRDPKAIEAAALLQSDSRFSIVHSAFSNILEECKSRDLVGKISGILMDLGVSSPQLDDAERGFSFMRDGPLDMRMDTSKGITAEEWLATASHEDMTWVIKTFGEEKFGKRIAHAIVEHRALGPINRTLQLAKIIADATPVKDKHKHPATRTFQAIRIYINSELEELKLALENAVSVIHPGGRLSIISFHSLEDRIVKQFIRNESRGKQVPKGLPLTEAQLRQDVRLKISSKAIKPSEAEIQQNPRARSSVLRLAEKI